jgi:hypothetical protein
MIDFFRCKFKVPIAFKKRNRCGRSRGIEESATHLGTFRGREEAQQDCVAVGCRIEYVRVVRQRRVNPERTRALDGTHKHRRYHADAEYRERVKARSRRRKRAARAVASP